MTKFSIIIPTYNNAKTIAKAIESVLAQRFKDFEIIIVDGGSSDGTLDIIKKYALWDQRITFITLKKKGPGSARNAGIRHAKGDFIAFLDADDSWKEDLLDTANKIIKEYQNDIDMIIFEYLEDDVISRKKRWIHRDHIPEISSGKDLLKQAFVEYFILTSGVVIRKSLLKKVGGFSEDLKLSEDWDLWLRVLYKARKVYYVKDDYKFVYTVSPFSLCSRTARNIKNRLNASFHVIRKNKHLLRDVSSSFLQFLKMLIKAYVNVMVSAKLEYIKRGLPLDARKRKISKVKLLIFLLSYDLWIGLFGGISLMPNILSTIEWNFRLTLSTLKLLKKRGRTKT